MKRGLILVLIFCMCISFVSFGEEITSLTSYKDKESGYTYFFGKFSEDLKDSEDIGFEIGGKYFSLNEKDANDPSKTAFEVACENGNVFGIGIKNLSKAFGSELKVTPYIETDNEIKFMEKSLSHTTYNKNPYFTSAYAVKYTRPEYYAPSDFDLIEDNNKYTLKTEKASNDKIYSNREVLLKYDISDFEGINEKNKITLKINILSIKNSSCKGSKIKVLTVQNENYSEKSAYYYDESTQIFSLNEIKGLAVKLTDNIFEEFTFDVTKIVKAKLENNESSITFVIQLNNDKVRDSAYVGFVDNYKPKLTIE